MNLRILAFIAIAAMSVTGPANADYVPYETGNSLLEYCESEIPFERGVCGGYLIGVSEIVKSIGAMNQIEKVFCMPKVTRKQLLKVFTKYANEHPEDLHNVASVLVMAAFYQAFPCE